MHPSTMLSQGVLAKHPFPHASSSETLLMVAHVAHTSRRFAIFRHTTQQRSYTRLEGQGTGRPPRVSMAEDALWGSFGYAPITIVRSQIVAALRSG
jgi:hypothetical protein